MAYHGSMPRARRSTLGVVLVCALALVAVACSGDEGAPGARLDVGSGELARYVPSYVPYDLPLAGVTESEELMATRTDMMRDGANLVVAWTDDPDDYPDADSRIIALSVAPPNPDRRPPPPPPVSHPNFRGDPDNYLPPHGEAPIPHVSSQGRWLSTDWVADDGQEVGLSSVGLDEAAFTQVRESVVLSPGAGLNVTLPDGFREVTRLEWEGGVPSSGALTVPFFSDVSQPHYSAGFASGPLGQPPFASYSVGKSSPSMVWISAVTPGPPPTAVEVAGHSGYERAMGLFDELTPEMEAAFQADPEQRRNVEYLQGLVFLQWWVGDVAFTVSASPAAEARRMAESLQEVDEAEWQTFVASATGAPSWPPNTVPYAEPPRELPVAPATPATPGSPGTTLPVPSPDGSPVIPNPQDQPTTIARPHG